MNSVLVRTQGYFSCAGFAAIRSGAIAAALVATLPSASALGGILVRDGSQAESANLATGEQLLLTARSGDLAVAGKTVTLESFTGIVGYSNELAYVVVLEGSAALGEVAAGAGHMLILRPYGAPASVEQFDAMRLAGKWSDQARAAAPDAYASLDRIRREQELGLWFGRLGQTSFNVAASGSAHREQETRTLMGNEVVRDIRFAGDSDPIAVEKRVATAFLDGLKAGDAQTVAALMDPTPFGGRALAGGADEARRMAAAALIASRNWTTATGSGAPHLADGAWRAGNVAIQLRTIDDFVFVSRISGGTK